MRRYLYTSCAGAVALALGFAMGGGTASAADECGPHEAGVEIVCSPSNYEPAGGNILYDAGVPGGDFSIRLGAGLAVAYDRDVPDDELQLGDADPAGLYRLGAVVVVPRDAGHAGDIAVSSSADVTSLGGGARGYIVGHIGVSGRVGLDLKGGSVTMNGPYGVGVLGFHTGEGDLGVALRGIAIGAEGHEVSSVWLRHAGNGEAAIAAQGGTVTASGARARGIFIDHVGTGDSTVDLQGVAVSVSGAEESRGIFSYRAGEGDTVIGVEGSSIVADGPGGTGIHATHIGTGDAVIGVAGGSIDVTGGNGDGIFVQHFGEGAATADLRGVAINVEGERPFGVRLAHLGSGDAVIRAEGGSIDVSGEGGDAIRAYHRNEGAITAQLQDFTLTAERERAFGVNLVHQGTGDIALDARGGRIDAAGDDSIGIFAHHSSEGDIVATLRDVVVSAGGGPAHGTVFQRLGSGDIGLDVRGGRIDAAGDGSLGILGNHRGEGDIEAVLRDVAVSVEGEESNGMVLQHQDAGNLALNVRGGSIIADGADVGGIEAVHTGAGNVDIHLREATVTASGEGAIGVGAYHETGEGSIRIRIDGGSVQAEGTDGVGVDIGSFITTTGALSHVAEVGEDGYRRQSVMVNGHVRGGETGSDDDGSGIWLGGGGRVEIGPRGSIGAASGVAVLAVGDGALLHVGADLDGRRAGDVIDGAIRNDSGRTTIAVNGVTLHDGMGGATGLWAPNGARDVTLVGADTVVGRSFSAADFVTGPYAPRAAVYEALPGFLTRLDGRGTAGERVRAPDAPVWVLVSGGQGSFDPERASVGASYDFDRFGVEAGVDAALSPAVTGSVSLRHVRGSAGVSARTGGGRIEAEGVGVALGAAWRSEAGYYVDSRVAVTRYEAELRSEGRGRLKDDADSTVRTLRVEGARRLALGKTVHVTPRAWLVRSDVSLDGARDAVGSRVSLGDAARTDAGLGIVAKTDHSRDDGQRTLSLWGELGVERSLSDAETAVDVSGERLFSEAGRTRMVLGLGGAYRWGRYSLGGTITSSGAGSDDSDFAGSVRFGMRF